MAAAFHYAGLEAWDVTVSDLLQGRVQLSDFRGLVFVGGFSYADVLDSGKVSLQLYSVHRSTALDLKNVSFAGMGCSDKVQSRGIRAIPGLS